MSPHSGAQWSGFVAGQLIAFTTALLITVLLLALTIRAAKLRGNPAANIGFAVCALFWSAGGLAYIVLLAAGVSRQSWYVIAARSVQYCGALAFPIPILAIWKPLAASVRQRKAVHILQIAACISAGVIAVLIWSSAGDLPAALRLLTADNAAAVLLLGAVIALRRDATPRAVYIPSWAILLAVGGAALIMNVHFSLSPEVDSGLGHLGTHLVLLVVLCSFFLFARFRFADIFIRYGVRILLAGLWAAVITSVAQSWHISRFNWAVTPEVFHVFGVLTVALILLLSFTFVDERIGALMNRWLFRTPGYRALSRDLAERLRQAGSDIEVTSAVKNAVSKALESSDVQIVPLNPSANLPAGILEGEILEAEDADALVPIATSGQVSHVLRVTVGPGRPGLVMLDLNFLRTVATQCGIRLDALAREREAIERESREALLVQQVTEAELRALRAQINPHFLFNSLNTIADLVVRDPARAESMTLRLAAVFRHVLAQSYRPLTTVREEMDFLRTYLYIEEARFGDRLQVEIEISTAIAGQQIPSLILQPLVENALKHGLGPKVGPGHLMIAARDRQDQLCLIVEDDGIGMIPSAERRCKEPVGLGLVNVSERLRALYQERASLAVEPRQGGGTRAMIRIPRSNGAGEP